MKLKKLIICSAGLFSLAAFTPSALAQAVFDDGSTPAAEKKEAPKAKEKKAAPTTDAHKANPYNEGVPVFVAGDDNPYTSIRIPDIIKAGDKLIAVAEGRYKDTDQGENDLIVSVSEDWGKSWSKPTVAAASKGATFNNPCLIYDEEKKQVFLFFQRYPAGVKERTKGIPTGWDDERCIRNFLCVSKDGKKWSKPKDVTKFTKHDDVTIVCSGPNPGVQIKNGKHKGRLVVPMNVGHYGNWVLTAAYSDNNGKSWKIGEKSAEGGGVNEVSIVETDEGGLLIVSRSHAGKDKFRKLAYSEDGGESWGEITDNEALPSPGFGCQNGLSRYSFEKQKKLGGKSRILYSSPGGGNRANGVLKMSYDNGKTWPVAKGIGNGPFGYSVLTPVNPGSMGILYEIEARPITTIKFTSFTIDWLTNGEDTGLAKGVSAEEAADDEDEDEADGKKKKSKKGKKAKKDKKKKKKKSKKAADDEDEES